MAILISDFKSKKVTRDKEEQLHINKSSIQQEDITVINIYILNEAIKAYEVKTNRFKRRNRPFYNDS